MNTQIQNEFKKPMRRQNWATKLKNDAIKTEIACDIVVDGVAKVVSSLYERFPKCQRHDSDPKSDRAADETDIRNAIRSCNPRNRRFHGEKFGEVVREEFFKMLDVALVRSMPGIVKTINWFQETNQLASQINGTEQLNLLHRARIHKLFLEFYAKHLNIFTDIPHQPDSEEE